MQFALYALPVSTVLSSGVIRHCLCIAALPWRHLVPSAASEGGKRARSPKRQPFIHAMYVCGLKGLQILGGLEARGGLKGLEQPPRPHTAPTCSARKCHVPGRAAGTRSTSSTDFSDRRRLLLISAPPQKCKPLTALRSLPPAALRGGCVMTPQTRHRVC
jgi:hypothetical protein